ncbi:MAG: galactokinase, partial [Oscillospiraceae bacterium]|nr:galactokinase [Oscillospiraceae bacterium]
MKSLLNLINDGSLDKKLTYLYGSEKLAIAHERCLEVINGFSLNFDYAPENLFSAPGRTELGGNHTDHQHGRVIAASVDIDLLAAVSPTENGVIRVQSNGYPLITVSLDELTPKAEEKNGSAALIRGVAARMAELGSKIGGFDAYIISDVPGGSGLSSSAAFEDMVGNILNHFYNDGSVDNVDVAKMAQYAENVFFGKPCGLMDQMACG